MGAGPLKGRPLESSSTPPPREDTHSEKAAGYECRRGLSPHWSGTLIPDCQLLGR